MPVPPGALDLILVRHGQSQAYTGTPFPLVCGHGDPSLSRLGLRQAERVRDRLASAGLAAIYVSSLRRTAQTATPLAARLGLTPVVEAELREVYLGEWEGGLYRKMVAEMHPIAQRMFAEERWDVIPGAESLVAFHGRIRAAIGRLLGAHAGERVAVFTHGGVIGQALALATGSRPFAFNAGDNASISRLIITDDRWFVQRFNDTAHLEGIADLSGYELVGGERVPAKVRARSPQLVPSREQGRGVIARPAGRQELAREPRVEERKPAPFVHEQRLGGQSFAISGRRKRREGADEVLVPGLHCGQVPGSLDEILGHSDATEARNERQACARQPELVKYLASLCLAARVRAHPDPAWKCAESCPREPRPQYVTAIMTRLWHAGQQHQPPAVPGGVVLAERVDPLSAVGEQPPSSVGELPLGAAAVPGRDDPAVCRGAGKRLPGCLLSYAENSEHADQGRGPNRLAGWQCVLAEHGQQQRPRARHPELAAANDCAVHAPTISVRFR